MSVNEYFEAFLLSEFSDRDLLVAGIDEVGRGALFGSVVASAVILPLSAIPKLIEIGVKDSKKLSAKKRESLIEPIKEIVRDFCIGEATVEEIDRMNILQASLLAMKRAVLGLKIFPDVCLVDGKFAIPELKIVQKNIISGDNKSSVISAASIVAKVWRDNKIANLAAQYPEYDLATNKGYPTKKHLHSLSIYGVSPLHRRSFSPCRDLKPRSS